MPYFVNGEPVPEELIRQESGRAASTGSATPGHPPDRFGFVSVHGELKASILLFYSLLDEQQRRLYAGLESLKLGRGGDRRLAGFLDLDPHTVARGRQQLLAQDVEVSRARRAGGGRKPVEKKLQK